MLYLKLSIIALFIGGCSTLQPTEVVRPRQSQSDAVVVTDIDGTLTPRNIAVLEPRPSAADALVALSKKGYNIVYLTTRLPLFHFQSGLPDWLARNGFPVGSIHVAQSAYDRENPEKFKTQILSEYVRLGWRLAYAYGDSSTDFAAYASVGIPKNHVFALKRRGDSNCQAGIYQMCLDGWTVHLPFIDREVSSTK